MEKQKDKRDIMRHNMYAEQSESHRASLIQLSVVEDFQIQYIKLFQFVFVTDCSIREYQSIIETKVHIKFLKDSPNMQALSYYARIMTQV